MLNVKTIIYTVVSVNHFFRKQAILKAIDCNFMLTPDYNYFLKKQLKKFFYNRIIVLIHSKKPTFRICFFLGTIINTDDAGMDKTGTHFVLRIKFQIIKK